MPDIFFEDRRHAGKLLAVELKKLHLQKPLVLCLPRGGVLVGDEIATALQAELDIVLVRKLGAPFNEELAVGAIVEGGKHNELLNQELLRVLKVDSKYLDEERKRQWAEIARRQEEYRGSRARASAQGREVVLVDDGIATGASIRAAIQMISEEHPKRLILAVGVIAPDVLDLIRSQVSGVVALNQPADFRAVGQYFRDFRAVEDAEVIKILKPKN